MDRGSFGQREGPRDGSKPGFGDLEHQDSLELLRWVAQWDPHVTADLVHNHVWSEGMSS